MTSKTTGDNVNSTFTFALFRQYPSRIIKGTWLPSLQSRVNINIDLKPLQDRLLLETLLFLKSSYKIPGARDLYHKFVFKLVKESQLFDEVFYLENNLDVAQSSTPPLQHYILKGDREGRSPMPFFDPDYYRAHSKSNTKQVNALLHYSIVGRHQRTPTSPWFDLNYYLSRNVDVARSKQDPLLHYLRWGGFERRSPSPHFDSKYYLEANPNVQSLRINPLLHYLYYGRQAGLRPLPDPSYNKSRSSNDNLDNKLWDSLTKRSNPGDAAIDIIVPVYKGKNETLQCLYSVLSSACNLSYELIVINDQSPDFELAERLRKLAGKGLFKLLTNSVNRGFVYSVNRGMALHKDRDVVLLNADTEVYHGWLDRLHQAAYRDQCVGTVTPLSNNATICSYPRTLHDNPYPLELSYEELDAMNATLNNGKSFAAPTGVGFCMYVKRECLNQAGLFDETLFGKGYGEENDFCQRAIQINWKNIIAADVFVRHWGATSFKGERAKRVQKALDILDELHPDYRNQVASFVKLDPLRDVRYQLDWNRLLRMRQTKNILLINHNRGGGSERRVQEDVQRFLGQGLGVFILRPHPEQPEMGSISHPIIKTLPNLPPFKLADSAMFIKLLQELNITEVQSHSFVDFSTDAPEHMTKAFTELGLNWIANLHDYKVICPRINLADENGLYCGEPDSNGCNLCLKERKTIFETTTIQAWRETHERLLLTANKVTVPSIDVAKRIKRHFPKLAIEIVPHEQLAVAKDGWRKPILTASDKLRVVVVGAIGKLKGHDVLLACAKHAKLQALPLEFILMGYSMDDPALEKEGVEITGQYQDSDALATLKGLNPHAVWLPSLWPETYSYTLSIALAADLPIFAFALGAITERLKQHNRDALLMDLALHGEPEKINQLFAKFRLENIPS